MVHILNSGLSVKPHKFLMNQLERILNKFLHFKLWKSIFNVFAKCLILSSCLFGCVWLHTFGDILNGTFEEFQMLFPKSEISKYF